MYFRLINALAVLQGPVIDVLQTCSITVFLHLDDVLIFSRFKREHVQHIRCVLQRLLENQLFIKAEKSQFQVMELPFLRFVVSIGSIQNDPAKGQRSHEVTSQPQGCLVIPGLL